MQIDPTQIEPLLSPEQVSKIFDIELSTLTKWRSTNRVQGLPFIRIGGSVRYQKEDVERFIRANICMGAEIDHAAMKLTLHANPVLYSLASRCADATMSMVRKTSYAKFLRAAVALANTEGATPEQFLRDQLVAIQAEVDAHEAWVKQENDSSKLESAKLTPMLQALANFEQGLTNVRSRLRSNIVNIGLTSSAKIASGRNIGLTDAELQQLGWIENPEVVLEKLQNQVADIDAQLAKIAAFAADPLKSTKHLVGLNVPGFDFTQERDLARSIA